MRPLPALSDAYLAATALGKTAAEAGAAAGFAVSLAGAAGFASAAFGAGAAAGGAGAAVVVVADAGVASALHSALRKSFHFLPSSVPADLAASYFALHSCIVSAWAGIETKSVANPDAAAMHTRFEPIFIWAISIPRKDHGTLILVIPKTVSTQRHTLRGKLFSSQTTIPFRIVHPQFTLRR